MRVMHWREKVGVFCGFTLLPSACTPRALILCPFTRRHKMLPFSLHQKECTKSTKWYPFCKRAPFSTIYAAKQFPFSKRALFSTLFATYEAFMIEIRCLEATFSCKSYDLSDWYQSYISWIKQGKQ